MEENKAERYTTKELCEHWMLKVKYDTFTAHSKTYLDRLRLAYDVRKETENGRDYYFLTSKNNLYYILRCKIGKRDINIIEKILKVIMDGNVVPVREQIGKAINVPPGTVQGYIQFLKKNEIIAKPKIEKFVVVNEDGEIVREYKKKKAAYVYYDIQKDGSRVKLPQQNVIHNKYGNLWKEKYDNHDYLHLVMRNLNYKPLAAVLRKDVWEEINSTFGLNKGARIDMLFINSDIKQQLQEYFYQVT